MDPKRRLCCLLAASEQEADKLMAGARDVPDAAAFGRRVGLPAARVRDILDSPGELDRARISLNGFTRRQLERVPELPPARIRRILDGRPYFSALEFEQASGLARETIDALFAAPELRATDKVTGRTRHFTPVFGRYITSTLPDDFESLGTAEAAGFAAVPASGTAALRVLLPLETETTPDVAELKRALGGDVAPVVQDADGLQRFFVPGIVDVWFAPGVAQADAVAALAAVDLRVLHVRPAVGYYQAELAVYPADLDVTSAVLASIGRLADAEMVAFAEPAEVGPDDFGPEREVVPNQFEDAGHGPRDWPLAQGRVPAAHARTTGSERVTVLVIDSGLRVDHRDLEAALRPDWTDLDLNFDVGVPEAAASPEELAIAHGTKVASVVGGRGPQIGGRVRGVAPGAWILPVKISGAPFAQSYGLRAAAIRESLDYLAPDGRAVINISWSTSGEHIGVREALVAASARGVAITTSAGNYAFGAPQAPDTPHYPSHHAFLPGDTEADIQARRKIRGLASVAALNAEGRKASYSYYGAHAVTVSAPGGERGAAGSGVFVASTPADYAYDAGTSLAAPFVAGVIALIWAIRPDLTAQQAIDTIRDTARDLDADNPDYAGMLGGLVDARAALDAVAGPADERPPPGRLNVNAASAAQLEALPLIGGWSARRIVADRSANGPYATIWELPRSGAIQRWAVAALADRIKAGPVASDSGGAGDGRDGQGGGGSNGAGSAGSDTDGRLNVNTASAQALEALPYIGAWAALAIVGRRAVHGPYASIWDLTRSGAVDRWTIRRIADLIRV